MPAVVQDSLRTSSVGFMLKDKLGEPIVSGFTAVNGRASPPSPRKTNGMNGVSSDAVHVRPFSSNSPEEVQDAKPPMPIREEWNSSRATENGISAARQTDSPTSYEGASPVNSPGKRKRSSSVAEERSYQSNDADSVQSRKRLEPYTSVERADSPTPVSHQQSFMEGSREYQSVERAEHDRSWATRDPRDPAHHNTSEHSHREPQGMDGLVDRASDSPTGGPVSRGSVEGQNSVERSSTTEITRAGVQVDPKKRKRQFTNRTKTGCGTCRRRKKKCDEAKPECNNCTRGGFICEGYAHKVSWQKSGVGSKTHIPLQAKDKYAVDSPQLYHSHGHARENYDTSTHPTDGARVRPIVLEEPQRQTSRDSWTGNWADPQRASYPPEHPPVSEYTQQPSLTAQSRPPSHDHHVEHPSQSQRQSVPRIHHYTPQPMSQPMNSSPAVTAQLALQHQSSGNPHQHHSQQLPPPPQHHSMHPPQSLPPGHPPPHHAPPLPKPQKSEKEKMLNGEYYLMFSNQLIDEREQCKAALYRFNSSSNPALGISREERKRHFRTIIEAPWTRHREQSAGSLGKDVHVDAPFTCEYGYNIHVGDNVVIQSNCTILDSCRVSIGNNTIIGPNVSIFSNTVSTDPNRRNGGKGTAIAKPIEICDNVFIGGNVTILPGIKVGKGATIGAGSVVTRNVPPHVVVSGNPATVRRGIWKEPYS
ncbi:hypothetical protein GQ43DRAFT_428675 [Delitschia confertaspora ATCC 74209]|uniref:Zn(2)-C6 fungal-type domain-containing protein n=1 Tax=Delitschia confertaspora ATCC 74209 TaxID=1513339 RepID=A0A9P4JSI7_9PLEO|nr:hypothetical protein GQ43DRAFT_428675 [Delitschia confertaspora ATCC 74209]